MPLTRTTIAIALLLAYMLIGTIIGARSTMAHRMTGGDIRRSGVHHCTWSAAIACKRPSQRRQVPCGNGRYCRW
jgi:hypothetical protein